MSKKEIEKREIENVELAKEKKEFKKVYTFAGDPVAPMVEVVSPKKDLVVKICGVNCFLPQNEKITFSKSAIRPLQKYLVEGIKINIVGKK